MKARHSLSDIHTVLGEQVSHGGLNGPTAPFLELVDAAVRKQRGRDPARPLSSPARRIAYLLLGPARADRTGRIFAGCVWYWREVGLLGVALSLAGLDSRKAPFPVYENGLEGLPLMDRLLIANQRRSAPRSVYPELDGWCDGVFAGDLAADPEGVLGCLDRLAAWNAVPSPALRDTVLASPGLLDRLLDAVSVDPRRGRGLSAVPEVSRRDIIRAALRGDAVDAKAAGALLQGLRQPWTSTAPRLDPERRQEDAPAAELLLKPLEAFPEDGALWSGALEVLARRRPEAAARRLASWAAEGRISPDEATPALLLLGKEGVHHLAAALGGDGAALAPFMQRAAAAACEGRPDVAAWVFERVRAHAGHDKPYPMELELRGKRLDAPRRGPRPPQNRQGLVERTVRSARRQVGAGNALIRKALDQARAEAMRTGKTADPEVYNLQLGDGYVEDARVDRCALHRLQARRVEMVDVTFSGVLFTGADFAGASLRRVRFENCRFREGGFTGAELQEVQFRDCDCSGTVFAGVQARACTFTDVRWSGASFQAAALDDCTLHLCTLEDADLSWSRMQQSVVRGTRFSRADVTRAFFRDVQLLGVEWRDGVFHSLSVDGLAVRCGDVAGCGWMECRFRGLDADLPEWRLAAEQAGETALLRRGGDAGRVDWLTGTPAGTAERFVEAWAEEERAEKLETRYRQTQKLRIAAARHCMGHMRWELLELLPYFLCTDAFERRYAPQARFPICAIDGYAPSPLTRDLARTLLDGYSEPPASPHVRAAFLAAPGALGSVAMDRNADLEAVLAVWPGQLDETLREGLETKVQRIATWVERRLGAVLRVRVEGVDTIRDRALAGDEAGAQERALALEDFLAEGVFLAGRIPGWWSGSAALSVDLGRPAPPTGPARLEPELRRFAGALDTTLESFLRLTLLADAELSHPRESGASGPDRCRYMRRRLARGELGVWSADPVGALFVMARQTCTDRGEREPAELMDLALLQRVGRAAETRPGGDLCTLRRRQTALALQGEDSAKALDPVETLELGRRISARMSSLMERIAGRWTVRDPNSAKPWMLDPQTMAMLSRPVQAAHGWREHKVERVSLSPSGARGFRNLRFRLRRRRMGAPVYEVWASEGAQEAAAGAPLHEDGDPARLFAWVAVNRIFREGVLLDVGDSLKPVAPMDVWRLLPALQVFFPASEVFRPRLEQGADPERVERAYCIANLTAPRTDSVLRSVSVLYATSWGEVFCRTFGEADHDLGLLRSEPREFLGRALHAFLAPSMALGAYIPAMSRCPHIAL